MAKLLDTEKNTLSDRAAAIRWYRKAALGGNPDAQFWMGDFCGIRARTLRRASEFKERRLHDAARWYELAASQGHVAAQLELGFYYRDGLGVRANSKTALSWFRAAFNADSDVSGLAAFCIGAMYRNGDGVERDYRRAAAWFRKASILGDESAVGALAQLHLAGRGAKRDVKVAINLLVKAADGGCPAAAFQLGELFREARVVEHDPAQTYKWYRIAAEELPIAQWRVAECFRDGIGTRRNATRAYDWLRRAADAGCPEAVREMKGMS